MNRALASTALLAVLIGVLAVLGPPFNEAEGGLPDSAIGSWDRDIAARVWRERPFARVGDVEGQWMLVAGAYYRPSVQVDDLYDTSGVRLPSGERYPQLVIEREAGTLSVGFDGVGDGLATVGVRTGADTLLPDPIRLDPIRPDSGARMACRHIEATLERPETLLCRRDLGQRGVNYECYTRSGVEHPMACRF